MREKKVVLIVDDEEEVLWILSRFLNDQNYRALIAPNSEEAWAIARNQPPDVLILDLLLQEQDGYETLVEFRSEYPSLPIVVLTGLSVDEQIVNEVEALGATICLEKATPIFDLLATLNNLSGDEKQVLARH